tara:strand:- start:891 stop:1169 length:279 start_codon:yes stop_codon:yes gene_type:complete
VVNNEDDEYDDEEDEEKTFAERIVISSENDAKGAFDVLILFFVGYSCFTTLYYVAFGLPTDKYHLLWDSFVEYMFYTDFLLQFITDFYDEES